MTLRSGSAMSANLTMLVAVTRGNRAADYLAETVHKKHEDDSS
jgi:hypothetical protein